MEKISYRRKQETMPQVNSVPPLYDMLQRSIILARYKSNLKANVSTIKQQLRDFHFHTISVALSFVDKPDLETSLAFKVLAARSWSNLYHARLLPAHQPKRPLLVHDDFREWLRFVQHRIVHDDAFDIHDFLQQTRKRNSTTVLWNGYRETYKDVMYYVLVSSNAKYDTKEIKAYARSFYRLGKSVLLFFRKTNIKPTHNHLLNDNYATNPLYDPPVYSHASNAFVMDVFVLLCRLATEIVGFPNSVRDRSTYNELMRHAHPITRTIHNSRTFP